MNVIIKNANKQNMPSDKRQIKHDMLNDLSVLKANIDLLSTEKPTPEMIDDMVNAIEELERTIGTE